MRAQTFIYVVATLLASSVPTAFAQTVAPAETVVEGRLYDSLGAPLNSNNVSFVLEVYDSANTSCILYRETHASKDLSGGTSAAGVFALRLGTGTSPISGGTAFANLFSSGLKNGDSDGNNVADCSFTPAAGSARLVRVKVDDLNDGLGQQTLAPDTRIGSVPIALVAENAGKLDGKAATDFVSIRDDATYDLNQGNLENVFSATNYAKLTDLLSGTSSQYLRTGGSVPYDFNSQRLTNLATPNLGSDATNKNYVDGYLGGNQLDDANVSDVAGNGFTLVWDQGAGRWRATDGAGLANVSASRLQGRAVSTSAPTGGQVLLWNATSNAWQPGSVSVAAITSLSGDVVASGSGAVTATISNNAVTTVKIANGAITSAKINNSGIAINRLLITNGTDGSTVGYKDDCTVNEVLRWTSTGWQCAGVNTLAPVTSVAGKTGAVTLNANDVWGLGTAAVKNFGTSAGELVELDSSARLPALNASLLQQVNAVKLQAYNVASTAPAAGNVLTWNNSASRWEPAPGATGDIQGVVAGNGLSGGGISGAVTLSVNAGSGANQIVKLDSSARLPAVDGSQLTNVTASSVTGGYVQGGNAFGTAATLGTNDNFALNFETNAVTRLTINNSGNLGIGTTSPVAALDVIGTSSTNSALIVPRASTLARPKAAVNGMIRYNSDTNKFEVYEAGAWSNMISAAVTPGFIQGGNSLGVLATLGTNDTFGMTFETNGAERVRIDASGNVGVGTTSPSRLLHVNGPIRVTASALPIAAARGDIAVDLVDSKLKWHDGFTWQPADGGRISCPTGFSLVGTIGSKEAFCISKSPEAAATWLNAAINCSNKTPAARLCSASEWLHACVKAPSYGISGMPGNWEWVAGFNNAQRQAMGFSDCGSVSDFGAGSLNISRCCFR